MSFVKCEVDTSLFTQMINELKLAVPSANENDIIREEVGKVLEKCIEDTTAMQVQKVVQRSERAQFTTMPSGLYKPSTKRARENRSSGGRIVYYLKNRYPSPLWAAIKKRRKEDLAKILKARGLAKKSWYLIAEKLGIRVKAPKFVRDAVATTGKEYFEDVEVHDVFDNTKIEIRIGNNQPTINAIGGSAILQRAIDGRVKFFLTNLKHGVFESLGKVAKKYPGLKVTEE